jgi:hypothetical protein
MLHEHRKALWPNGRQQTGESHISHRQVPRYFFQHDVWAITNLMGKGGEDGEGVSKFFEKQTFPEKSFSLTRLPLLPVPLCKNTQLTDQRR